MDFRARVSLSYHKLSIRGYSSGLLYKYFFKFINSFPVRLKYNIHDVKTLWTMSIEYDIIESCNISNSDDIMKMIKPLKIMVNDAHS